MGSELKLGWNFYLEVGQPYWNLKDHQNCDILYSVNWRKFYKY